MNIKLNKLLITLYLLLFTSIIFPPQLKAQSIGLSIHPPLVEVMIQPGKSITQAYQLVNNSDYDLYLVPQIVPFTPADHQGNIFLPTTSHQSPAASFFSLQNKDISLNQPFMLSAGNSQQLVLRVNIPENNEEKDYYYTFLIEQSDRELLINQGESRHRIKIGGNLLITVSEFGEPRTDFKIAEFKPKPKFADTLDTVKFNLIIENTGQAFFKPEGTIEIYHTLLNKKMAEMELLPENILVNSARKIRCKSKNTSEVSENEIVEIIPTECTFSSWLPGKYRAVIHNPHQTLTANSQHLTYFYLIPYRLILALIILFIIIWQIRQHQKLDN